MTKSLLEQMREETFAAIQKERDKPASEKTQPFPPEKVMYPIGLTLDGDALSTESSGENPQ